MVCVGCTVCGGKDRGIVSFSGKNTDLPEGGTYIGNYLRVFRRYAYAGR